MRIRQRLALALGLVITMISPSFGITASPIQGNPAILKRFAGYLETYKAHPSWPGYTLSPYTLIYGIGDDYYLLNSPISSVSVQLGGDSLPGLPGIKHLDTKSVHALGLASDHVWDEKSVFGERILVAKQIDQANTAQSLDPIHEFLTVLHENFHATAQEQFMYRIGAADDKLLNAADFAYTQLEASLLARLLNVKKATELREGIRLYLAVRETHDSMVPKTYADYRVGMSIIEGTAQYLADSFFLRTHPADEKNHLAYSIPRLTAALQEPMEDSSRYYLMGSAACHLLDRLMPRWQERFNDYVDSLDALLAEASDYRGQPQTVLSQLGKRYGIDTKLAGYTAQYRAIAQKQQQEIAQVLAAYRKQGQNHLTLIIPSSLEMGGAWAESWELPDNRKLTRAKLCSVTIQGTNRVLFSLENSSYIRSSDKGVWILDFYRNLASQEIKVNGEALSAGIPTATGSLEIAQKGFMLKAQEALVTHERGSYTLKVLKP